jgi:uncharacterized protein YecE (DUF72 family)
MRDRFGPGDSQLARYATRLLFVEINSSFYRPHRRATYERWASIVPAKFRFSVKLPREITHKRRLIDSDDLIDAFADETSGLGAKLAVVLVQLPPSLVFDEAAVCAFFRSLATRCAASIACEPRNASWFTAGADALLQSMGIARVGADPAVVPEAAVPGGSHDFAYVRLHGSPRIYASAYEHDALVRAADLLRPYGSAGWCIFDNTQFGAATDNALALSALQ